MTKFKNYYADKSNIHIDSISLYFMFRYHICYSFIIILFQNTLMATLTDDLWEKREKMTSEDLADILETFRNEHSIQATQKVCPVYLLPQRSVYYVSADPIQLQYRVSILLSCVILNKLLFRRQLCHF